MKNVDKYITYKEAENAFLTNCCGIPAEMTSMIPWDNWGIDLRNKYKAWLFEDNENNDESSLLANESQPKTISSTTVYWTNPPRKDDASLNNSAEDYDKIAKEMVDAWFEQHHQAKQSRLNKDRFDDYNSARLCFEYECEYGDEKSAEIYFSSWLFYPYDPSIVKAWKNGCKYFFRPRRHT